MREDHEGTKITKSFCQSSCVVNFVIFVIFVTSPWLVTEKASGRGSNQPPSLRGRGATAGQAAALQTEPKIFIYDNYPGGIGFSRPLFEMHGLLLERTHELITGCPCDSGCPSCVGPEGNTGPHAKLVAVEILESLLANEVIPS